MDDLPLHVFFFFASISGLVLFFVLLQLPRVLAFNSFARFLALFTSSVTYIYTVHD